MSLKTGKIRLLNENVDIIMIQNYIFTIENISYILSVVVRIHSLHQNINTICLSYENVPQSTARFEKW